MVGVVIVLVLMLHVLLEDLNVLLVVLPKQLTQINHAKVVLVAQMYLMLLQHPQRPVVAVKLTPNLVLALRQHSAHDATFAYPKNVACNANLIILVLSVLDQEHSLHLRLVLALPHHDVLQMLVVASLRKHHASQLLQPVKQLLHVKQPHHVLLHPLPVKQLLLAPKLRWNKHDVKLQQPALVLAEAIMLLVLLKFAPVKLKSLIMVLKNNNSEKSLTLTSLLQHGTKTNNG
jgi:hypothetical protein